MLLISTVIICHRGFHLQENELGVLTIKMRGTGEKERILASTKETENDCLALGYSRAKE